MSRFLLHRLVPVILALGVCVTTYFQGRLLAPLQDDNRLTFGSLAHDWQQYVRLRKEWRPRLLANGLAGVLVKTVARATGEELVEWPPEAAGAARPTWRLPAARTLELSVGWWAAGWLLAINLMLIASMKERSILYVLGIYAALSFGYMPGVDERIYPWDLPALFSFALFVVLLDRDRPWLLWLALPVLVAFKETALVLCFGYLLWAGLPRRSRLLLFASSLLACLLAKAAVDGLAASPDILLTLSAKRGAEWRLLENLGTLADIDLPHPLFINAGTLLALLLLPGLHPRLRMLKAIALLFACNAFVFAQIAEYRIWFELIPVALYGIDLAYRPSDSGAATSGCARHSATSWFSTRSR